MRKKLLTFLALLTVIFALPQVAKAWSSDDAKYSYLVGYGFTTESGGSVSSWTSDALQAQDGGNNEFYFIIKATDTSIFYAFNYGDSRQHWIGATDPNSLSVGDNWMGFSKYVNSSSNISTYQITVNELTIGKTYKVWVKVPANDYWQTKIETVAPSLKNITLRNSDNNDLGTLHNGTSAQTYTLNNPSGSYYIHEDWENADNKASYYNGTISANGTYTLSTRSGTQNFSFASGIKSAKLTVNVNPDKHATHIVVSDIAYNVTHASTLDGNLTGTVSNVMTTSNGVNTYYKLTSAITGAGTYTFTTTTDASEASFTIPAGLTGRITWNASGAPVSLKVTDPNAGISEITLRKVIDNSVVGRFTKSEDGSTWTWTGSVKGQDISNGFYYFNVVDGDHTRYTLGGDSDPHGNNSWWWNNGQSVVECDSHTSNGFTFNLDGTKNVTITLTLSDDKRSIASASYAKINWSHNFPPKAVREKDGNWAYWTRPAVFITANYLNDNKIVPDWEMEYRSDGKYHLDNVTLRGTQEVDGANSNPELTAHVYNLDGTQSTAKVTPSGLETDNRLQYGRSYNLVYDPSNRSLTCNQTGIKHPNYPPFFSLVGYNFQQEVAGETPNRTVTNIEFKNTSDGWQEAWVLYEGDYPLRDDDGYYFYNTQWPPKSPVKFQVKKGDDYIGVQSSDITFHRDSLSAPTSHDVMTGADWESLLKAKNSKAYATLDLDDSRNYTRYVIEDGVWVFGATKIWTGWGTQTNWNGSNNAALWSNHRNWGHKDKNIDNNGGTVIDPGVTHSLCDFGGNFMFAKPTYFQTFELFIPSTDDGLPSSYCNGDNTYNVKIFTTASVGNSSIRARATSDYHGSYIAQVKLPSTLTYVPGSVVITRYTADGNKVSSLHGDGDFTLSSPELHVLAENGTDITVWTKELELDNGSYFYRMKLKVNDGTEDIEVEVKSDIFTIANYSPTVKVEPMQLLRLSDEKSAQYGHSHITYLPEGTGKYYFVDIETSECFDATAAQFNDIFSSRENYLFTSDFYVKALDGNSFTNAFAGAIANNQVREQPERPDVYIILKNNISTEDKNAGVIEDASNTAAKNASNEPVVHKAVRSANKFYGKVLKTNGDLSEQTFSAGMEYTYYSKDDAANPRYIEDNRLSKSSHPVMPAPYGLTYKYEMKKQTDKDDVVGEEGTALNTQGLINYADTLLFEVPTGTGATDREGNPIMVPVYMKKADLAPRKVNCIFSFKRPNVTEDIVKNYDITYDVLITSNYKTDGQTTTTVLENGQWYDEDRDISNPRAEYTLKVKGVHPSQDYYPSIKISNTRYVVHGTGYPNPATGVQSNYGEDLEENATTVSERISGTVGSINLGKATAEEKTKICTTQQNIDLNGWTDLVKQPGFDKTASYSWLYKGHTGFVDEGDYLIKASKDPNNEEDIKLVNEINNRPHFYLVEAYNVAGEHASYAYLVAHQPQTEPMSQAVHDANDPLLKNGVGTWLGHFENSATPTIFFTPVYIFNRIGQSVGTDILDGEEGSIEVKLKKIDQDTPDPTSPASAPARRAIRKAVSKNEKLDVSKYNSVQILGDDQPNVTSFAPGGSAEGELTASAGGSYHKDDSNVTGIESVAADFDATVEYYNLQGIRVDNPQPGQVYIVRRGATTAKELLR